MSFINHLPILKSSLLKKSIRLFYYFFILLVFASCSKNQNFTRGIGIYPGDINEDFSPKIVIDKKKYHNLALRRPAYHSSCYNYNLTAQLINDGIIDTILPCWISSSTNHGVLKKNEQEWILDRHNMTVVSIKGSKCWVQFEMVNFKDIPEVDSINIGGRIYHDDKSPKGWECIVLGSEDGIEWNEIGSVKGNDLPGKQLPEPWRNFLPKNLRLFNYPIPVHKPCLYKFYRLSMNGGNILEWGVGELDLYTNNKQLKAGGPYNFVSTWMSENKKEEWVYIDLGAKCKFDRISLHWIQKAKKGFIQVSDNATRWKNIISLANNTNQIDEFKLKKTETGRYVRVFMTEPFYITGYMLSEVEIYGYGGPKAIAHKPSPIKNNNRIDLAGGNWKLQRESLIKDAGETLSSAGYSDSNWVIATVPGTILTSYLNIGAIPDPNFGDNQLMISESFFYSDFWYRNEFDIPLTFKGRHIFLNFDGINWKADVFLNSKKIGKIEGAFTRGKFDVTAFIVPGKKNALAVHVIKNETPGFVTEQTYFSPDANGGELGADNPTFHASVGWDWIPTVRGRNTGIWNDVYITTTGPVSIENPLFTSDLHLPDTSVAETSIRLTLINHESNSVTGILKCEVENIILQQNIKLKAFESKNIVLNSKTHPLLKIKNPKLWWPNGYGKQNLYTIKLSYMTSKQRVSDSKSFLAGIREYSYFEDNDILKIWINGKRFIGRGGNWGFSESLLRYRAREYDDAVHYHKDMNFTMIRNWVGQTGDDEFYDACDRYGIVIWQDFWLANPLDGPNPANNQLFLQNAEDMILRIRNHPSVGLFCGRNEGFPPEIIDTSLRKMIKEFYPGLHYISNSSAGVVSGGGPYGVMTTKEYFEKRSTKKLHSEMGMPNIVSYESLKMMMPDSEIWPQGYMWGLHDFCLNGAQNGSSFMQMHTNKFGKTDSVKDWIELAQWINYDGYRAMFEAQSKYRMGLLLWMSHPAWPSLVWQTYDYYFEPTAAYFACKKASEPIHILLNELSDSIEVFNYSYRKGNDLKAIAEIFNLDGTLKWEKVMMLTCNEDTTISCFPLKLPNGLTDVYFIRLKLLRNEITLSENFYWRGLEVDNYKAIHQLPKVKLKIETLVAKDNNLLHMTTKLTNPSKYPALMIKLKVVGNRSNDRILPVIFSDNYISLMPGEQRIISIEMKEKDTRGENPKLLTEGFNIK